jgi:hypothetical protein
MIGKTLRIIQLVFFSVQLPGYLFAQTNTILENFVVSEINGSVYISWTIEAGSTCDGTRIYRSTDAVNFYQIGEIVGICGSTTGPESYNFTDYTPVKNAINYYRLELGLSGFSNTLSIEIVDIGNSGYTVRPNPITDNGKIYFENPKNLIHTLELYSSDGRKVFETSSKERYFHLSNTIVPQGFYVFNISGEESEVSGTIIVQE